MSLSCCFTGHRRLSTQETIRLKKRLSDELLSFYNEGCENFYTGGALGFDTLAALAILNLRDHNSKIRLHLLLPFQGQESRWSDRQRLLYHIILKNANSISYSSENRSISAIHIRNRALVDNSHICLCYLEHQRSGTGSTVRYAQQKGLYVKNLFS